MSHLKFRRPEQTDPQHYLIRDQCLMDPIKSYTTPGLRIRSLPKGAIWEPLTLQLIPDLHNYGSFGRMTIWCRIPLRFLSSWFQKSYLSSPTRTHGGSGNPIWMTKELSLSSHILFGFEQCNANKPILTWQKGISSVTGNDKKLLSNCIFKNSRTNPTFWCSPAVKCYTAIYRSHKTSDL